MYENLTEEELAYIAGLVDGEGSFHLHKHKRNTGLITYDVSFYISNTKKELIDWLNKKIEGSRIQETKKNKEYLNRNICYLFHLTKQKNLLEFLPKIIPYLIIKRNQANIIFEFIKIRSSLYKRGGHNSIHSNEEEKMYFKIRNLNKRGTK